MEAAELTEGYRKLHSLKNVYPVPKGRDYISECVCGWQSEVGDFLSVRAALTNHVLDEADKIVEGAKA